MTLTDEEKAALIDALEAEGREVVGLSHQAMIRLDAIGLIVYHQSTRRGCLATAGQIVAELLKKESRLERAREKLKEWATKARVTGFEWTDWTMSETSRKGTLRFSVVLTWWDQGARDWCQRDPDPLTAVIEASKRTPWPLEE